MAKGHHEPKSKRDGGKSMCPTWVNGEVAKAINLLDGKPGGMDVEVMVAAIAVLGEAGFDVVCCEQTTNFEPRQYGPPMLEGYAMIAASSANRILSSVYGQVTSDKHPIQDIEEMPERMVELRASFDTAIRQFLRSMFKYLGAGFQADKQGDTAVAAGSQVIGMWQKVAESTIKFESPKEPPSDEEKESQSG